MQAYSETGEARVTRAAPGAFAEVDVILRDGRTLRLRPPRAGRSPTRSSRSSAALSRAEPLPPLPRHASRSTRSWSSRSSTPTGVERGALIGVATARRADRRARELGAAARPARRPRWRSPSPTRCRAAASARACSSSSPRSRGRGRDRALRRRGAAGQPRDARRLRAARASSVARELDRGDVELAFPIAPTARVRRARRRARPRRGRRLAAPVLRAAVASPSSAPRARRGTIGGELFRNVLAGDFAGAAYPVNRQRRAGRRRPRVHARSTRSPTRSTSP